MGNTDNTTKEWRDQDSSERRSIAGMIRRMAVTLTEGSFWRVVGHLLLDGKREALDAEVFGTLGFYSRPKPSANAEAIVVFPGGAANPVIIATRDEDMRKAQAQLEQDSALMCNRATLVLIRPNGTVEIRAASGSSAALPTMADFNGIVSIMNSAGTGAGTALPAAVASYQAAHPTWPTGTTVLKAQ